MLPYMNVFILSTGRCGSYTFWNACRHITNYTAGHETLSAVRIGGGKVAYSPIHYPENHIEIDNRLSWFLGTLEKNYGEPAFYVHLMRNPAEVSRSFVARGIDSILFSYAWGNLQYRHRSQVLTNDEKFKIGLHYCETVNDNIALFLKDKPNKLTIWLPNINADFPKFWRAIGAEGDADNAIGEWAQVQNKSAEKVKSWRLDDHFRRIFETEREIKAVVPEKSTLALEDDYMIRPSLDLGSRLVVGLFEQYEPSFGIVDDSKIPIRQIDRLVNDGVAYIVFLWPAFWRLECYPELYSYLNSNCHRIVRNDRLIIFKTSNKP